MINHCSRRGEGEEKRGDQGCLGGERGEGRGRPIAKKVNSSDSAPRGRPAFVAITNNRPKDARSANKALGQKST